MIGMSDEDYKKLIGESQVISRKLGDLGRPPQAPFPYVLAIVVSYDGVQKAWPAEFAAARALVDIAEGRMAKRKKDEPL